MYIKADQDICSLRSALNALQQDHLKLQDKYDALSHATFQKLAIQAAELTVRKGQVESLTTELHAAHEGAAAHSTEILRPQSAHDTMQTDLARHEVEEAS